MINEVLLQNKSAVECIQFFIIPNYINIKYITSLNYSLPGLHIQVIGILWDSGENEHQSSQIYYLIPTGCCISANPPTINIKIHIIQHFNHFALSLLPIHTSQKQRQNFIKTVHCILRKSSRLLRHPLYQTPKRPEFLNLVRKLKIKQVMGSGIVISG